MDFELKLPHQGFHRKIGTFVNHNVTPDGEVVCDQQWEQQKGAWLPTTDDGEFIKSLMKPVWEAGKYAGWIAPPRMGIDNKPGDFEYVQIHMA